MLGEWVITEKLMPLCSINLINTIKPTVRKVAHNALPTTVVCVLLVNFDNNSTAIFGFLFWIKPYGSSCSIY